MVPLNFGVKLLCCHVGSPAERKKNLAAGIAGQKLSHSEALQSDTVARQQTPLYFASLYCFLKPRGTSSFESLTADTTLYGARTVKLVPDVETHSEDGQLLMHESFLKEHFEIMPNMKKFPLLGGARSIQRQ